MRDFFERMSFLMPTVDSDLYWTTIGWPQQLQKSLEESEKNLNAGKVWKILGGVMQHLASVMSSETMMPTRLSLLSSTKRQTRYLL